jgi:integrative and conjugative element protein (TIGR02256 family)
MLERVFQLPEGQGVIVFAAEVLNHMYSYAQTSFWSKEAGGQLFSPNPTQSSVNICLATGPHQEDKRSMWNFSPDVNKATEDRIEQFSQGLHAVGLWHTHPEASPKPSSTDRITTQKYLDAFQGDMEAFLLTIVGNKGLPPKLSVWIAQTSKSLAWTELTECVCLDINYKASAT